MMRLNPKYIPLLATAVVLIAVFVTGSLLYPNFGTPRVIVNLLGDNAFVGVAAVGASFVILSGGIDLSAGSMVAFVGILIARLLQAGCDPFLAIGIALFFGIAAGALMGCLIHYFEMPPFLVTLAGLFCLRGLGFVIHPESIGIDHPFYAEVLPQLSILVAPKAVLPFTAMCFLASVIVGTFIAGLHPIRTQRLRDRIERKFRPANGCADRADENHDLCPRRVVLCLRGSRFDILYAIGKSRLVCRSGAGCHCCRRHRGNAAHGRCRVYPGNADGYSYSRAYSNHHHVQRDAE